MRFLEPPGSINNISVWNILLGMLKKKKILPTLLCPPSLSAPLCPYRAPHIQTQTQLHQNEGHMFTAQPDLLGGLNQDGENTALCFYYLHISWCSDSGIFKARRKYNHLIWPPELHEITHRWSHRCCLVLEECRKGINLWFYPVVDHCKWNWNENSWTLSLPDTG